MQRLKAELKNRLKEATRIAVLGVGSELRGDDGAGIKVAQELKESFKEHSGHSAVEVFLGGTAPENLTGAIKRFNPSHLIIIDSADFRSRPGGMKILEPEDIGGLSFSTHRMPIKMLAEYLCQSINCQVIIIGLKPRSIDFGKSLSKEVARSVKVLSTIIQQIISNNK